MYPDCCLLTDAAAPAYVPKFSPSCSACILLAMNWPSMSDLTSASALANLETLSPDLLNLKVPWTSGGVISGLSK